MENISDKHAPKKEKKVKFDNRYHGLKRKHVIRRPAADQYRSAKRRWRGNKTADNEHTLRFAKRAYRKHPRLQQIQTY